jgi:hypothetical protein
MSRRCRRPTLGNGPSVLWPSPFTVALLADALAAYAMKHPEGVPSYGIDFL